MDITIRDRFTELWRRYFNRAGLPLIAYYTGDETAAEKARPPRGHRCVISQLTLATRGKPILVDRDTAGCMGGRRYLGFSNSLSPDFNYFLSCGIPGKLEGERYKKTPEIVEEFMQAQTFDEAPEAFMVFKRWDLLQEHEEPALVIFLERPDVIAGLFTLAGYDRGDRDGVITPFGSGCMTTIMYPLLEGKSENPRAVLGMWDPSARPFVAPGVISFAVPWKRFLVMMNHMEECFLGTSAWQKVRRRIR